MPKPNVKNQLRFSKLFIMIYEKTGFGKVKLTVGELRGSKQKIQYCITAIEIKKTAKNPRNPAIVINRCKTYVKVLLFFHSAIIF